MGICSAAGGPSVPPAPPANQVRGFGFLHDGSVDTVNDFLTAAVFNFGSGATPASIKNVTLVFSNGVGYDPAKLTDAIKGQVGLR